MWAERKRWLEDPDTRLAGSFQQNLVKPSPIDLITRLVAEILDLGFLALPADKSHAGPEKTRSLDMLSKADGI
jgi:hypothetical protein